MNDTDRGDAEIARLRLAAAHAEIARLRLTDAEREAVNAALGWCDDRDTKTITILRSLLARTGGSK